MVRIGCLQFAPQVGDVDNNLNRADAVLSRANPRDLDDLDVLVLPEMAFTGYNFKSLQEITPFLEPTGSGISALWARTTALKYDCKVAVGYPEKVDPTREWPTSPQYFNSLLMVNEDGETVANHRKCFLYYTDETWALEGDYFYDGEIDGLGTTAMGICMDINPYRFEAPFHAFEFAFHVLDSKANLVIVSMAWNTLEDPARFSSKPYEPDMQTLEYWAARFEPLIRAENLEEEIILVFANRSGIEGDAVYAGTSAVIGILDGEVNVYGVLGRGTKELLVVDTDDGPWAKLVRRPGRRAALGEYDGEEEEEEEGQEKERENTLVEEEQELKEESKSAQSERTQVEEVSHTEPRAEASTQQQRHGVPSTPLTAIEAPSREPPLPQPASKTRAEDKPSQASTFSQAAPDPNLESLPALPYSPTLQDRSPSSSTVTSPSSTMTNLGSAVTSPTSRPRLTITTTSAESSPVVMGPLPFMPAGVVGVPPSRPRDVLTPPLSDLDDPATRAMAGSDQLFLMPEGLKGLYTPEEPLWPAEDAPEAPEAPQQAPFLPGPGPAPGPAPVPVAASLVPVTPMVAKPAVWVPKSGEQSVPVTVTAATAPVVNFGHAAMLPPPPPPPQPPSLLPPNKPLPPLPCEVPLPTSPSSSSTRSGGGTGGEESEVEETYSHRPAAAAYRPVSLRLSSSSSALVPAATVVAEPSPYAEEFPLILVNTESRRQSASSEAPSISIGVDGVRDLVVFQLAACSDNSSSSGSGSNGGGGGGGGDQRPSSPPRLYKVTVSLEVASQ